MDSLSLLCLVRSLSSLADSHKASSFLDHPLSLCRGARSFKLESCLSTLSLKDVTGCEHGSPSGCKHGSPSGCEHGSPSGCEHGSPSASSMVGICEWTGADVAFHSQLEAALHTWFAISLETSVIGSHSTDPPKSCSNSCSITLVLLSVVHPLKLPTSLLQFGCRPHHPASPSSELCSM